MADDITLTPFGIPEWVLPFGGKGIQRTWRPGQLADQAMMSLSQEERDALKYAVPVLLGLSVTWLMLNPDVVTGLANAVSKAADAVVPDSIVGV